MATPLTFNAFTQWKDIAADGSIPADARPVSAADLLRYETFMAAVRDRVNAHDTVVENVATAVRTPFVVQHRNGVWDFASVAEATAAGLRTGQIIMFVGNPGGTMPTWARVGDIWTQG